MNVPKLAVDVKFEKREAQEEEVTLPKTISFKSTEGNIHSEPGKNPWHYKRLDKIEKPTKLFIFLHGFGMDADDMCEMFLVFKNQYPNTSFISLSGFEPYEFGAYGRQWFPLNDRSDLVVLKNMKKSFGIFQNFLSYICNQYDISLKDIFLIGFSQGGMLSAYAGMNLELGGVLGFASCLVAPQEDIVTSTPMCFIHGENDEIIDLNLFKRTIEAAKVHLKQPVETLIVPNLKHAVCFKGLKFGFGFLHKHF